MRRGKTSRLRRPSVGAYRPATGRQSRPTPEPSPSPCCFNWSAVGVREGLPLEGDLFARIPVLTRPTVQQMGEALWNQRLGAAHGGVHRGQTSGSTGMPVRYLQTDLTRLFWRVFTLREHLWQGRDFSGKLAAIRSNVEKGRSSTCGAATEHAFHTGAGVSLNIREDVAVQLDWLVAEAPQYILTHPSNLRSLLRLAVARAVTLPGLLQVRTFGEMLPAETVDLRRQVWGVGVADVYSSEEVGNIAFHCERGRYHVQAENVLLEIIDAAGNPLPPGRVGRVVMTVLHNLAMPLIRYEIGDYAAFGEACPCGRGLPVPFSGRSMGRNCPDPSAPGGADGDRPGGAPGCGRPAPDLFRRRRSPLRLCRSP